MYKFILYGGELSASNDSHDGAICRRHQALSLSTALEALSAPVILKHINGDSAYIT